MADHKVGRSAEVYGVVGIELQRRGDDTGIIDIEIVEGHGFENLGCRIVGAIEADEGCSPENEGCQP